MMNKGKAMGVVKDISSDRFTDEEKAEAIYLVMNMATHNFFTKADLLNVIKWFWHNFYEYAGGEKQTQFDRIKLMNIKEMAKFFAEKIMQQKKHKLFVEENSNITATQVSLLNKEVFMQCLRWLESEVEEE